MDMVHDEGKGVNQPEDKHGVGGPLMEDLELLMRHSRQCRDHVCLCAQRPTLSTVVSNLCYTAILTKQMEAVQVPSTPFSWQWADYSRKTWVAPRASSRASGPGTLLPRMLGLLSTPQEKDN